MIFVSVRAAGLLCTLFKVNMFRTKFELDRFEVYGSVIDVDVEE